MQEATPTEGSENKHPSFVWHSTTESVENGTFSVLAAGEVVIAVVLYWLLAFLIHSQSHLWVSIAIAPLLLLRSEASVALGVRWFEYYVDHGFRLSPEKEIRSIRVWIAAMAAAIVISFVVVLLARILLSGPATWLTVVLGFVVAYLAMQAGVATGLAIAANEIVALLARIIHAPA